LELEKELASVREKEKDRIAKEKAPKLLHWQIAERILLGRAKRIHLAYSCLITCCSHNHLDEEPRPVDI